MFGHILIYLKKTKKGDVQSMEIETTAHAEEDLYTKLKNLQKQIDFLGIQEDYIKDEQKNLKRELLRAQEEVKRIQSVPLIIGQFLEMIDPLTGIVGSTSGTYTLSSKIRQRHNLKSL